MKMLLRWGYSSSCLCVACILLWQLLAVHRDTPTQISVSLMVVMNVFCLIWQGCVRLTLIVLWCCHPLLTVDSNKTTPQLFCSDSQNSILSMDSPNYSIFGWRYMEYDDIIWIFFTFFGHLSQNMHSSSGFFCTASSVCSRQSMYPTVCETGIKNKEETTWISYSESSCRYSKNSRNSTIYSG